MSSEQQKIFYKSISELKKIADELEIEYNKKISKSNLIDSILEAEAAQEGLAYVTGCLEIMDDGYGFLRFSTNNYNPGSNDVYVSLTQIRRFRLRKGHMVSGPVRSPKEGEKYFALLRVDAINAEDPEKVIEVKPFERLTPYYPEEKFNLENNPKDASTRIVDLFTPIGKGQRGLIVAAPRTGKTVLMQLMINAILDNHEDVYVIVLLVDERPEEVTEMKKIIASVNSEVISSTFDETSRNHIQVSEMVLEKAKRMVELGKDVVIMLDSITRLARAYNNVSPSSGKVLSGGIDSNALHRPKKFFGAARNALEQGTLTIIATALVDTGSRMDQVIYEEFKGTGNMDLILDRSVSDMRLYPAIDLVKSGTRREELLLDKKVLNRMFILRKLLKNMSPYQGIEMLRNKVLQTKNNAAMLTSMSK